MRCNPLSESSRIISARLPQVPENVCPLRPAGQEVCRCQKPCGRVKENGSTPMTPSTKALAHRINRSGGAGRERASDVLHKAIVYPMRDEQEYSKENEEWHPSPPAALASATCRTRIL
jgi:hypothetical protein